GLALSGGGIRSASFALGVMQALAGANILKRMDYLSTVSGGGYIGSALTWFLSKHNEKANFGLDSGDFPFGHDSGRKSSPGQGHMLDWLRQHGKYLTPGKGITLMSGIAVVLRGILLNLIVWVPILIALFWLMLRGAEWLSNWIAEWIGSAWMPGLFGKTYALLLALSGRPAFAPAYKFEVWESESGIVMVALCLITLLGSLFLASSIVYSLVTVLKKKKKSSWRYWFRRFFETAAPWVLWPIVILVVVASLPYVDAAITQWLNEAGGPLAALTGIISGLWTFLRTSGTKTRSAPAFVPIVGASLVLYGIALLAYQLALQLPVDYAKIPFLPHWSLLISAIVTGLVVNINYISIHRFYRDRLMEAYLPEYDKAMQGQTGVSVLANSATLESLQTKDFARSPCHIINANLVLVNSKDPRRRTRGGDNFILTAFYCGSSATGWLPAKSFLGGRLTLATAMAISGAAANPNTGSDGVGVTRNRAVSLLMALLNIRLGYWLPNWRRICRKLPPNHFVPGLGQIARGHREDACYIELSDGGHFENLALYELIRRQLKLIILCDGAADPKFGFADLNSLRRRIAADFGARITFEPGQEPENLIPERLKRHAPNDAGYAVDADMAKTGHLQGRIDYADGSSGALVYIKTTMVKTVSFGVKAYKGAHHDFPDETTADQFFDEEQFDAYRELGRHLGREMLEDTKLGENLDEVIKNGAW
ncbi:MAG: patatin-like phospholipase family protein, partial [Alphaproteobacteria bacterium]|nr:patatin-like phospholipase family protein [Alphaproteobacteria bacterium]